MSDEGRAAIGDEGISTRRLGCFIVLAAVIVGVVRAARRRRPPVD
ncbi:MAG TPA: hypothetical protein VH720_11610 [Candidatus Limnocylindrales bacterium]|jgi:hypothetical protein